MAPPTVRLARLKQREQAHYDDNSSGGHRTLANHMAWLGRFACPVLELRGDLSVVERVARVQATLRILP